MFGITGAHRSGKTTLAKELAESLGFEFLETKVTDVFTQLGVDPKANLPFDQRIDVQNEIMKSLQVQYELRSGKMFIADRTPFDVLGYTMADIQRNTLDEEMRAKVYRQVNFAAEIIANNLLACLILPPLHNQPEVAGKAQSCPLYMHHVYLCIKDMVGSLGSEIPGFIAAEVVSLDINERIQDGLTFFGNIKSRIKPEPKIWIPDGS